MGRFLCVWGVPGGSRRCPAGSKEVPGGQGKPRAPERWPESPGRGLDDDFLLETFSCQVWVFFCVSGAFQVAPGGVQLGPRRSQEVRGSLELQNGGLRALGEAWMMTFCLRRFPVKCGSFSVCLGRSRWLQEVSSWVQGGPRRSGEAQSPKKVTRRALL